MLLGWDKRYYGVYDAGASWAGDQVHAGVLDFFLQELVELPTQLLHQLSNLYGPKKKPQTLIPDDQYHFFLYVLSTAEANVSHTQTLTLIMSSYFMWGGSESNPAIIQRDDELTML